MRRVACSFAAPTGFEYSDTGNNRRKGTVTLLGNDVHAVDVGVRQAPEGETLH